MIATLGPFIEDGDVNVNDAKAPAASHRSDLMNVGLGVLLVIAGVVLWALISLIPFSFFLALQHVVKWTAGHLWRQVVVSLALCAFSFLLLRLRERHRLVYGSFEIIVALGGFWYALATVASPEVSAAAIIASIYVFVRGADNYKNGILDQHRRMGLDDEHRPLPTESGDSDRGNASG